VPRRVPSATPGAETCTLPGTVTDTAATLPEAVPAAAAGAADTAGAGQPRTTFTCPRCAAEVTERFWGPCTACRRQLAPAATEATAPDGRMPADGDSGAGGDSGMEAGFEAGGFQAPGFQAPGFQASRFQASRFEPAMHVTPNHVATKD
jgi:hypothetical protein